jgi:hypothetical protein
VTVKSTRPNPATRIQFLADEDRRVILAPGLSLEFLRDGDRWNHTLAVGGGQGLLAVIGRSIEADPSGGDPARVMNPVYQEIEEHLLEAGRCVLLTGQSTPHHFSAVVTARQEGASTVVEFDIADRCRAPIDVLAATYLVHLDSSDLIDANSERIVWGGDALGKGRLEFATRGSNDVALAEAGRRASRVQALARIVPGTYTQRLFYSWRYTPSPL